MVSDRELAEAHWGYTEKIIVAMLEVVKVSYIEALIHGIKTEREKHDK